MPTPARTVQLRSLTDVIAAYENWDTARFAIWNGKQLLFTYDREDATIDEGVQYLQQWLEWIQSGGSSGIYTLAIYKNSNKDITNTTPYNGSVNFQLNEYSYNGQQGAINGAGDAGYKLLLDKMNLMQMDINKLKEGDMQDADEDEDGDALGQITKFLENPIIAGLISSLLPGKSVTPVKQVTQPNYSSNFNEPGTATKISGATDPQQEQQRLAEALKMLQANVPDLPAVLERLNKLAEVKPLQFKLYLSSLMNMKL